MPSPASEFRKAAFFIVFGLFLGSVPGLIKTDQMRRKFQAENETTQKQIQDLRAKILSTDEADQKACQVHVNDWMKIVNAKDGVRTILVDQNHPLGGRMQNLFGVSLVIPPAVSNVPIGPTWIIPENVKPQVQDGALGALYTHIWPDGRTDGWQTPEGAR